MEKKDFVFYMFFFFGIGLTIGAVVTDYGYDANYECEEVTLTYNVVDTSQMSTQQTFYLNQEKEMLLCEVFNE